MIKPHAKQIQDALLEVRISLASLAVRRNINKDNLQRLSWLISQRSPEQVAYLEQIRGLAK